MIRAYKDQLCVRLSDTKHIHPERPFIHSPGEILWKSFSANSPDLWNCNNVAAVPSLQMKARATLKIEMWFNQQQRLNAVKGVDEQMSCCVWMKILFSFLFWQRAICIHKWVSGCVAYLVPHLRNKTITKQKQKTKTNKTTYSNIPVIYCLVITVCWIHESVTSLKPAESGIIHFTNVF